ncbi:hypothetical protein [Metabacillus litoralis]|uniref:hypothetical protein n=1 Tax=Metabacillus litoralis TaxID=152268 RepID=UPI0020419E90|nr:hypothetical protein [Metabacillus litoralis]MCM3413529.1 hypothetical protein [Metabacillus litoralis]
MKVTVKSIPVRYDGDRYLKGQTLEIKEEHFNEVIFEKVDDGEPEGGSGIGQTNDPIDLSTLTAEELQKIKNDDMKSFLDSIEIQYESKATKDELIALILGKEENEQPQ